MAVDKFVIRLLSPTKATFFSRIGRVLFAITAGPLLGWLVLFSRDKWKHLDTTSIRIHANTADRIAEIIESIEHEHTSVRCIVVLIAILGLFLTFEKSAGHTSNDTLIDDSTEITVTVYPLGVQLTTTTFRGESKARLSNNTFLPRANIIDIIVSEGVLSYKVVSTVLFRVSNEPNNGVTSTNQVLEMNGNRKLASNTTAANTCSTLSPSSSMHAMLKSGQVTLIPAFPGVEMSYKECQTMWYGLSAALKKC